MAKKKTTENGDCKTVKMKKAGIKATNTSDEAVEETSNEKTTGNHIRYGGRQKGTVNKVTAMTKGIIADLLGDYQESGLMSKDFLALEPKDRMACAEKLMQYIMPKMQSTAIDFNDKSTKITIEQKLRNLSKDNEDAD